MENLGQRKALLSEKLKQRQEQEHVFKDGVGYNPAPLIASVKGRVGIN